jgi:tRNA (guanine-N7-)-methyltransferase
MGKKDKLRRFAENETFDHVIQPQFNEVFNTNYKYKQKWSELYWKNPNPIILELGCGKGEYTIQLAQKYPNCNCIGIDIKGARLWRGAKTALEDSLQNVAFIRSRIEFLESFFGTDEISEIWITFPDPQKEKRRTKKRLTSPRFLNMYKNILQPHGKIHLKTDSKELYEYTKSLLEFNKQPILIATDNLYESTVTNEILEIKTFYEQGYLAQGKPITYLQFEINSPIVEIED